VLAPVLGGVPVAIEVAHRLGAPLDSVIIRRLLVPHGPGSEICAVHVSGTLVLDEGLEPRPDVPSSGFDHYLSDALASLARRAQVCRGEHPPIDLAGQTIILVDCGIHTGGTMRVAIRALRTRQPARIIVAVPVAAPGSRATVEALADDLVCLSWPEPFGHVGLWYSNFSRPDDDSLPALLRQFQGNTLIG